MPNYQRWTCVCGEIVVDVPYPAPFNAMKRHQAECWYWQQRGVSVSLGDIGENSSVWASNYTKPKTQPTKPKPKVDKYGL